MMDLVHSHRFPKLYDLQKKKEWRQKVGLQVSDRVGKRVGILGYGSIGRQGKFRSFLIFLDSSLSAFQDPTVNWTLRFKVPRQRHVLDCGRILSGICRSECAAGTTPTTPHSQYILGFNMQSRYLHA